MSKDIVILVLGFTIVVPSIIITVGFLFGIGLLLAAKIMR